MSDEENSAGSTLTRESILAALRALSDGLGRQNMRPKTLVEVALLALDGGSFDVCLANFLDEFYSAPRAGALAGEPPLLEPRFGGPGRVRNACLAATAAFRARNLFVSENALTRA